MTGHTYLHAAGLARNAVKNGADVAKLFSHGITEFFLPGSDEHGSLVESLKRFAALSFVAQGQQLQHGGSGADAFVLVSGHVIEFRQHGSSLTQQH